MLETIRLEGNKVVILDQTELPLRESYKELCDIGDVWRAIRDLEVRGAPLIGVAAAYGIYIASLSFRKESFQRDFEDAKRYLLTSRPTAVNLEWALCRMEKAMLADPSPESLLKEAERIHQEDADTTRGIGEAGAALLREGMGVLTYCNAGALATSGIGTALAPVYIAKENGISVRMYAAETRPLLQGARLTSYELSAAGIDTTLIADNMISALMRQGSVDIVITGADRIAANGDTANKIGTSSLAILASHYSVPFYVAAPSSTIDMGIASGEDIPIEERDGKELTDMWYASRMAPSGIKVWNPAFDVTDNALIKGIITEKGIIPPSELSSL